MSAVLDKHALLAMQKELGAGASALPTCLVLAVDLALLSVAIWLATRASSVAHVAATLFITLALLQFYLIHHECAHRSVFARDRYNVLLGELLGFVLVYPFRARRRSHMLHHAWAGHLERDPTNARARARLAALSARQRRFLSLLWRLSFPFLAINERIGLWRSCLLGADRARCGARGFARERLCAYAALTGYFVVACACPFVAPLWAVLRLYLPALFLFMVCEELVNLPHHIEAKTVVQKLALWEQGEVTHSLADVPFWSRFVLLHFNLHTAHHLFPALPWFRLALAARALARYGLVAVREHELSASLRLRRRRFVDVFAAYLRGSQP